MKRVLVAYGTTEGHTRKIAQHVGESLLKKGLEAEVIDTANLPSGLMVEMFDGFVLAGSLHQTKHQASLVHFAKTNLTSLASKPSAMISSSLSAVGKEPENQADAQRCLDTFLTEVGWKPTLTLCVAGALLYTKYDFFKRYIMKSIVQKQGGDTDTAQDYEYTDWDELDRFAGAFAELL